MAQPEVEEHILSGPLSLVEQESYEHLAALVNPQVSPEEIERDIKLLHEYEAEFGTIEPVYTTPINADEIVFVIV